MVTELLLKKSPPAMEALVTVEGAPSWADAGSTDRLLRALRAAGILGPLLQLGLADEFIEHGDPGSSAGCGDLDAAGIDTHPQRFVIRFRHCGSY
jgi:1-deoxy-D-xylulose-5-phosphate synthase